MTNVFELLELCESPSVGFHRLQRILRNNLLRAEMAAPSRDAPTNADETGSAMAALDAASETYLTGVMALAKRMQVEPILRQRLSSDFSAREKVIRLLPVIDAYCDWSMGNEDFRESYYKLAVTPAEADRLQNAVAFLSGELEETPMEQQRKYYLAGLVRELVAAIEENQIRLEIVGDLFLEASALFSDVGPESGSLSNALLRLGALLRELPANKARLQQWLQRHSGPAEFSMT